MTNGGRPRRGMLLGSAVLLAVAVVAIALQGAPVFSGPRFVLPAAVPPSAPAPSIRSGGSPAPVEAPHEVRLDLSWLLIAVIVLAVLAGLALLWRWLRRRIRLPLPALPGDLGGTAEDAGPAPEPEPEPETVRRGLTRALEVLDEHREPRDAIERAWLGLEEAADDSGVHRLPAETPGEFTARILGRVAADREAGRSLLNLYLRVRFGDAPVTEADVAAARSSLEALRASWHEAGAGRPSR